MTTQHVTAKTKMELSICTFLQRDVRVHHAKKKESSLKGYFAEEFQVVAVVLMFKLSRRSKKGQMKFQVDPSTTCCINVGSFSVASERTFAFSVAACGWSGGGQFLTET